MPNDPNVIPDLFDLTMKSNLDGNIKSKARCATGGHCDKFKYLIVQSVQTLQAQSLRFLLAIRIIFGYVIWIANVLRAYLQSDIPLQQDIFIKSVALEFELRSDECLMLLF